MKRPSFSAPSVWGHYPWLFGLLLSPLLYGSVNPDAQVMVALLFALSLLLLSPQIGAAGSRRPICRPVWLWLAVACLVLPLVPLPATLAGLLNPQRAALGRNFPIDPGITPGWLTLTISPVQTVRRLWELGLVFAAFWLARHSAGQPGIPRQLAMFVGVALFLLAASDVWFRLDSRHRILGIWTTTSAHAAGSFANRNHFANWVYVGALFAFGWILRTRAPLQSARDQGLPSHQRRPGDAIFLAAAILFSVLVAVATGSRGGIAALLGGLTAWVILLAHRSHSRKRGLVLGVMLLVALPLVLAASDYLLGRFAEARHDASFKLSIWRDSLRLFARFPLVGSGLGTFATGFNHFKSFGGEYSFLHGENEYVQLLVEIGLVGCLFCGIFFCHLIAGALRYAWRAKLAEPELAIGAIAGLAAFAVHALFDFPFQILANAVLAAVLSGLLVGFRDQASRPALLPPVSTGRILLNLGCAIVLFIAAGLQGFAFLHWQAARRTTSATSSLEHLQRSLRLWPWDTDRQIALVRAQVRLLAAPLPAPGPMLEEAGSVRGQINRALVRDPFNWELRLERAWFDLAFLNDQSRARDEAWEVVKLNPLQAQIPLRFARHFAASDPAQAMEFVRAVPRVQNQNARAVLALAWNIDPQTASLWSLTPDTVEGLEALGDFAVEQKLFPLAAQAYQRLTNRFDPVKLAKKFLEARRPDRAIALLPQSSTAPRIQLLLSRACWQAGRYPEAIRHAESVWLQSRFSRQLLAPSAVVSDLPVDKLRKEAEAQSGNRLLKQQLAEKIFLQPASARDLALLRSLAAEAPENLRLGWLVFQTELDSHRYADAAQTALQLATRVAGQDR